MKAHTYLPHGKNPKKPNKILYKPYCYTTPYYKSLLLHGTLLQSPLLHDTLLQSSLLHDTLLWNSLLHDTLLQSPLLHDTLYKARYYMAPYYKVCYYTTLFIKPIATWHLQISKYIIKKPKYYFSNILQKTQY